MAKPTLSDDLAAFVASGLSITLAVRDANLESDAAPAWAALARDDREHVTLYVPADAARPVLVRLRAHPEIAVLFDRPTEHRVRQLKGRYVRSRRARVAERAEVERQLDGFRRDLETFGIPRTMSAEWKVWPCVAIEMRVTEAYEQSPGPGTGERLP